MSRPSPHVGLSYGQAKLLTLVAFLATMYWEDVGELLHLIVTSDGFYAALASLGTFFIYTLFKGRIASKVINIKDPNRKIGILFLVSSIFLYLMGSYSTVKLICHVASLVLFACSYLMIRLNDLALRIFLPILFIALALSLLTANNPLKTVASVLLLATFASSILMLSKLDLKPKLLVLILNALLYYFLGVISFPGQVLFALTFLELLISWLAMKRRSLIKITSDLEEGACQICGSSDENDNFCPFCGRILVRGGPRSKFEIFEVALFLVFLTSSLFISIPILVEGEEGIVMSYLRLQGPYQHEISFSSSDWLLYERLDLKDYESELVGSFLFRELLVPESLPETKNYTVVFESAPRRPSIANSWRFSPWKVHMTQNVLLDGSISAVYYEISSKVTLLRVIVWTENVNLFIGEHLVTRALGISIFRNYTYVVEEQNLTYVSNPSSVEFLEDVEKISFNTIRELELASGWSSIISSTKEFLLLVSGVLFVALVVVTVLGITFFAAAKDRTAESYLLELLSKERLEVLLAIDRLTRSGVTATGENLFREIKTGPLERAFDARALLKALDELEKLRLVKKTIRLSVSTAFLEWKLAF